MVFLHYKWYSCKEVTIQLVPQARNLRSVHKASLSPASSLFSCGLQLGHISLGSSSHPSAFRGACLTMWAVVVASQLLSQRQALPAAKKPLKASYALWNQVQPSWCGTSCPLLPGSFPACFCRLESQFSPDGKRSSPTGHFVVPELATH